MKKPIPFTTVVNSTSRRQLLMGGAGALALLALPGCDRSAVKEAATGSTTSGVKTLVMTQSSDFQTGTMMAQNNPNLSIMRVIFNPLTEYDVKTMEPKPSLASGWKMSDDQKTLTLDLRTDVTFHNGAKFTSADVLAAIAYMQKDTTPSQVKHDAKIITASAASESQVVLTLEHPVSNIFDMLEMMVIPQKDSYEQMLTGAAFVGTGPFKVDSYKHGQGMSLSANEKYFKGRPKIDKLEVQIVAEASSRVASLKTGASHISMDLPQLDITSLITDSKFVNVIAETWDSAMYVGSNVTIAPLEKKEVRQAIAWSVDRDAIVSKVLSGIGQTSSLPWSKRSLAYDEAASNSYKYNPDKAKEMITAAGAAGQEVKIHYVAAQAAFASVAEIVQAGINATGLKATMVPMQPADFFKGLSGEGLPGLFVNGHGFGQMRPATLLKGAFPFNADKNASRFSNDQYKALANAIWQNTDAAKAKALYGEVNALMLDQQFISDLALGAHTYTISTRVKGLAYTALDYLILDQADLT
ncbi:MAG: ABC transporter substrate-binding protein [Betaproteobacteria bacterium]